ncbi:MAG: hypothetical protein IPP06_18965, partial [Saprospiraceae bacterium]|nr:hypothetical protein [Candidatus Vicinibacter affinis]
MARPTRRRDLYHGTSVALTAVPDPGWVFGGWSGALSGQANPDTLLINGDKSVTATFLEVLTVADADDFNGCALDPRWTVVDPFNDRGVAAVINAYSDSARVAISVPGDDEHEIWNGFIGATHILQPAANTDFVLEVKFDSLPPSDYGPAGHPGEAGPGDMGAFGSVPQRSRCAAHRPGDG